MVFPPTFQGVSKDCQHICSRHVIFTLCLYASPQVKDIPPRLWPRWSGGAPGLCTAVPRLSWKWKHERRESGKSRETPAAWRKAHRLEKRAINGAAVFAFVQRVPLWLEPVKENAARQRQECCGRWFWGIKSKPRARSRRGGEPSASLRDICAAVSAPRQRLKKKKKTMSISLKHVTLYVFRGVGKTSQQPVKPVGLFTMEEGGQMDWSEWDREGRWSPSLESCLSPELAFPW